MTQALGTLISFLFLSLSLLHAYWAMGGDWGSSAVVPEVEGGRAFTPTPGATLAVAGAFFVAALVVLGRSGIWGGFVPAWIFYLGTWVMAAVFFLRAVGDFRLAGFFKTVRGTRFARRDSLLYSPLCFFISAALAALSLA